MATFVFLLAIYAALAGLVAYARRDRFSGPGIAISRSARSVHVAARSVSRVSPTRTDLHELVREPQCVC